MNWKIYDLRQRHAWFQVSTCPTQPLGVKQVGPLSALISGGLSLMTWSILAVGLTVSPVVLAAHGGIDHVTIPINNACDTLVVPMEDAVPVMEGVVGANPGDTIRLVDNIPGGALHTCTPTFDVMGTLLTGNGITIEVDGVTLDLDGHSIISASNVALDADEFGLDVENCGVCVGGREVTVTNTSTTTSVVENFTANFDFKSRDSFLRGMFDMVSGYNLIGGAAHGGAVLAIDGSRGLTIDTVELNDMQDVALVAPEGGDNAIDLKGCIGGGFVIQNSFIHGPLTGVRIRDCGRVDLVDNIITGGLCNIEIGPGATEVFLDGALVPLPQGCTGEAVLPEPPPPTVLTLTKVELKGSRLKIEGGGAMPLAMITLDSAVVATAEADGSFRIRNGNYMEATPVDCTVEVGDGAASVLVGLPNCP